MAYTPLACDRRRSVLGHRGTNRAYTAFGHALPGVAAVAFNGERPEPTAGHYILGHGYRAYSPILMRFERSDDASPFGEGGINSYAYCAAEPINHTDPSGRVRVVPGMFVLMGVALGIVGGVMRLGERGSGDHSESTKILIAAGVIFGLGVLGTLAPHGRPTPRQAPLGLMDSWPNLDPSPGSTPRPSVGSALTPPRGSVSSIRR